MIFESICLTIKFQSLVVKMWEGTKEDFRHVPEGQVCVCVCMCVSFQISRCKDHAGLTFTVKPLLDYSPQQRATVVTEGGGLVVVDVELVWDIDAEAVGHRLWWQDKLWTNHCVETVCSTMYISEVTLTQSALWQMFSSWFCLGGLHLLLVQSPKGREICNAQQK